MYFNLYYKDRKQLKTFFTQTESVVPLTLDSRVRAEGCGRRWRLIKITCWRGFLPKSFFFSHHLRMYPSCTHISTFDRAVPVAGSMARSRAARHCPDGLLPLAARLVARRLHGPPPSLPHPRRRPASRHGSAISGMAPYRPEHHVQVQVRASRRRPRSAAPAQGPVHRCRGRLSGPRGASPLSRPPVLCAAPLPG